jgi:hypothetical protein
LKHLRYENADRHRHHPVNWHASLGGNFRWTRTVEKAPRRSIPTPACRLRNNSPRQAVGSLESIVMPFLHEPLRPMLLQSLIHLHRVS